MQQHLHKYLALYKKLSIPELGHFRVETIPATADPSGRFIAAPRPVVLFEENNFTADKDFYDFLSVEMNINEIEAIRVFNDFSHHFTTALATANTAVLTGIGRISREENGNLVFSQYDIMPELLPSMQLPANAGVVTDTISQEEYTEEVMADDSEEDRNDSWWIYAVVLSLLGFSAILYYYTYYSK